MYVMWHRQECPWLMRCWVSWTHVHFHQIHSDRGTCCSGLSKNKQNQKNNKPLSYHIIGVWILVWGPILRHQTWKKSSKEEFCLTACMTDNSDIGHQPLQQPGHPLPQAIAFCWEEITDSKCSYSSYWIFKKAQRWSNKWKSKAGLAGH